MATILDRLTTILDFKSDTSGLQQAETSLVAFKANSMRVFGALATVFGGGFFLTQIADAADDAGDFANSIGVAVEQLSEMEYVVQLNGGSVEGLRGSLFSLNATLGGAERGMKRALKTFKDYHISIKNADGTTKTATEIMTELNRKFQTLSASKQIDLASKLGLDRGTIAMLQMMPAEYDRHIARARELGVLTQEDADRAGEYSDALLGVKRAIGAVGHELGAQVFPGMTKAANAISAGISLMREHSRVLKIVAVILGGVALAWAWVKREAIMANIAMLAIPIAIAAAFAAVVLVIDDLMAFWEGQDSIMGDIAKKWPMVGKIVRGAIEFMLVGFNLLTETLGKMWQGFKNFVGWISAAIDKVQQFAGAARQFFDWAGIAQPDLAAAVNVRAFPQAVPFIPPASGNTASVTTGDINISVPGGDAQAISTSIGDILSGHLQNTVQNFDSGIKR